MPTPISLPEAMEQITDAVAGRIRDAQEAELADLGSLIIGERARTGFTLPSLWIMAEAATNVERHTLQETWEMPVSLVAIVAGDDPESASRLAVDFAARARSAVVYGGDRRMGLKFVHDVQSTSFDPARRSALNNRALYSAAATVTVRFAVFERPAT